MATIETNITVTPDGHLTGEAPPDLQPGEYRAVLEPLPAGRQGSSLPFDFPVRDVGPWPGNLSLRREDLYGEDGR
ncbi:MAG TPA: hypothetical protein VFC63_07815 [Blastocatellia bacterium]|nr:hypothetical protein [Blastocatellia bacterium]